MTYTFYKIYKTYKNYKSYITNNEVKLPLTPQP